MRDLVGEFATRLREELDYRLEARNARTIASCLPAGSRVYVPQVYEDLSTSRVLVMEWLDGVDVRQVALGRRPHVRPHEDGRPAAAHVPRADADRKACSTPIPHPGNVMLLADGRLALIDFGAAGRLDSLEQAALRDMLAAVTRRDADAVVQAVLQVARLRRGVDVTEFERALARFMAQHLAPGSRPDAAMFNAMLRLFFDFGITLPAEWSTFFRALIVLEGTLMTIAPNYSVIDAAETIAAQWVRSQVTPGSVQQAVRDEILRTVPMIRRLPRHIDRAFSMLERDGLRVRVTHFADDHDEHVVTKLVNRFVLAFLSGTIGLASVGAHRDRGRAGVQRRHVVAPCPRVLRAVLRDGPRDARDRRGACATAPTEEGRHDGRQRRRPRAADDPARRRAGARVRGVRRARRHARRQLPRRVAVPVRRRARATTTCGSSARA